MLGIHISVAVAWQRASAGDWMAYAADVSRRSTSPAQPAADTRPTQPEGHPDSCISDVARALSLRALNDYHDTFASSPATFLPPGAPGGVTTPEA
jgi:hypothetical protein